MNRKSLGVNGFKEANLSSSCFALFLTSPAVYAHNAGTHTELCPFRRFSGNALFFFGNISRPSYDAVFFSPFLFRFLFLNFGSLFTGAGTLALTLVGRFIHHICGPGSTFAAPFMAQAVLRTPWLRMTETTPSYWCSSKGRSRCWNDAVAFQFNATLPSNAAESVCGTATLSFFEGTKWVGEFLFFKTISRDASGSMP